MKEPAWIARRALLLLHQQTLAEHGGHSGARDDGLLDSALARPLQIFTYEAKPSLARLSASYAAGIVRNHPFADGNKRAAFLAVGLFLGLNGYTLDADQVDAARKVLALAAGEITERKFEKWIQAHLKLRE
ncbi:MAG TPA: type II toxin-antitoxin system death-on-curing family toxin [Terriglobia bacterium]|nr:type II toxin-antitoxin system death-on-curing family toxin [Terriglobia bacterium]